MDKKWVMKEQGPADQVNSLASGLGVDPVLANLLVQRVIKSYEEARIFFNPDLKDLHDPFLMKDLEKAVRRIREAIENNEKILIYGDYDVDGTTSVALVYSFLKKYYPNLLYYIPNRYTEGYGISSDGIDYAAENDVKLIIALDCGIKAVEKIAYAKERKIDFIVCDHHMPDGTLPDAFAILDPKQPDCKYPFKDLSGCGVGFKLLQGLCTTSDFSFEELTNFLDLVAVSIASDIVPITGENRILAYFGIRRLNEEPCSGLKSIIKISGLENKTIGIDDIVFKIGPPINAAGRMKSGRKSVDLLISSNDGLARKIGDAINIFNNDRKSIDRRITNQAIEMIAADPDSSKKKSTVLFNPKWHKGVIGIVASRLIETYYKPTVVLTESNGMATGSARSVPGFDLYHAMENCSDLLVNFGGHTYAAGMTMEIDTIPAFRERFEKEVASKINEDLLTPKIEVDSLIALDKIIPRFYNTLRRFEPFGPGNMSPVFKAEKVIDNGMVKKVGASGKHLKLAITTENNTKMVLDAIGFNQAGNYQLINMGMPFDICFTIEENNYRNKRSLQLNIKDIKTREDRLFKT